MSENRIYTGHEIARAIVESCQTSGARVVFLAGNGGSGKTELSKLISMEAEKTGHANVIDMDDFVVDTKLRNSATASWDDPERGVLTGRYTTAFPASYFLQNVRAILNNLAQGNDYYHWPKKASDASECRLLYADALVTIVDGAGTVFLDKNSTPSVCVYMRCSKDLEIARRVKRARFSNEQNQNDVLNAYEERNSQYRALIEPHVSEYGLLLESLEDYRLQVLRDDSALPL